MVIKQRNWQSKFIQHINIILSCINMMSSSSVMDNVNKYRHGVLIGNFVEDKFGNDLSFKGPQPDVQKLPTSKHLHDPSHSLYQPHALIKDKQAKNQSLYKTGKRINEENYKRPENESSYNIFHRQEVTQHVPVLGNNPKREDKINKNGQLYSQTRKNLTNKFAYKNQSSEIESAGKLPDMRETGNIYNLDQQQIPDILTGEIYRAPLKKPDADTKIPSIHTGEPMKKIDVCGRPKSLNPHGTTSLIQPEIKKYDQSEYKKQVLHNERGEDHKVLFGHGLQINEFHRKQLGTSYDLSYNQHIQPQTQVNSFYNVDHTNSARKYHKQSGYEKTYQEKIPEFGKKDLLSQQKWGRPYDPYTKTYDKNHLKHEYLRT